MKLCPLPLVMVIAPEVADEGKKNEGVVKFGFGFEFDWTDCQSLNLPPVVPIR
jgi:hypothetical protein